MLTLQKNDHINAVQVENFSSSMFFYDSLIIFLGAVEIRELTGLLKNKTKNLEIRK